MIKSLLYIFGICVAAATAQVPRFEDADTRKKIVVVDTPMSDTQLDQPYMCKNGAIAAQIGYRASFSPADVMVHGSIFRHGENIVNIIASRIDQQKYCIYLVAWYQPGRESENHQESKRFYVEALDKIKNLKNLAAVNMSLAGPNVKEQYYEEEFKLVEKLTTDGVKVVVALGNDHKELTKDNCWVYPACLQKKVTHPENFYVVGALQMKDYLSCLQPPCPQVKAPDGVNFYFNNLKFIRSIANYSSYLRVDLEEWKDQGTPQMSGTSQATANFMSKMFSRGNP